MPPLQGFVAAARGAAPTPVARRGRDALVDEVPVAMVYDDVTLAVLMATPTDLVDLATGFTLTEGVSEALPDVEVVRHPAGIECRMSLPGGDALALRRRARALTAGSSCGLCGVRSLAQAVRAPADVAGHGLRVGADDVGAATAALRAHQPLHDATHAAHAAGFHVPGGGQGAGMVLAREDVGRHNALDKLVGALRRSGTEAGTGVVVLTSRVSIEMVQKVAALGAPVIVAVSAPTALAVRVARAAGITLIGNARRGALEVFTHPHRVVGVPHPMTALVAPARPPAASIRSAAPAASRAGHPHPHPTEPARP